MTLYSPRSFCDWFSRKRSCDVHARSDRKKHRDEQGAMLIEVLVGMLVLVIVFTATVISLASASDQRVKIEARDRALALLTNYEELSRVYKCGFIVDSVPDSLAGEEGLGAEKVKREIENCDFAQKAGWDPAAAGWKANGGDQSFLVHDANMNFFVQIRYWWEMPGSNVHQGSCDDIKAIGAGQPLILTRFIKVMWSEEGGLTLGADGSLPTLDGIREETVVKRDPVPADNVVFASGSRVNLLFKRDGSMLQGFSIYPIHDESGVIDPGYKIFHGGPLAGDALSDSASEPYGKCVWFPYVTPDGHPLGFSKGISGTAVNSLDTAGLLNKGPQEFNIVSVP